MATKTSFALAARGSLPVVLLALAARGKSVHERKFDSTRIGGRSKATFDVVIDTAV